MVRLQLSNGVTFATPELVFEAVTTLQFIMYIGWYQERRLLDERRVNFSWNKVKMNQKYVELLSSNSKLPSGTLKLSPQNQSLNPMHLMLV